MKNNNSRRSFLSKAAIASALMPFASLQAFGKPMEDAIEKTPMASAPSDLKIENVTPAYMPNNRMYVKITTNQVLVGYGEGVDAIPGTYYLVKQFGARLKGQSPLNVHRIFEDIRKGGIFQGAQAGMYIAVLSAIEIALWDLAGKALGVPVYRLLGGKFRDKIRVYYDTVFYAIRNPPVKEYVDAGKKGVGMGFNAIKYDIDEANDPNKYDRYNWTMSPGELIRMEEQVAGSDG